MLVVKYAQHPPVLYAQPPSMGTDDDKLLEFYWDAASGNVHHYNVYLSIDGGDYALVGQTSTSDAPTQSAPYALPIQAINGKIYRIKVEAEDASGITGPMSEPSEPVLCLLPPPGAVLDRPVSVPTE